jgi:hypothetical protein
MIARASLRFGMVGAGQITQAFRGQIENFTRAIHGEDKLLGSPKDILVSVEVIETAYDSLHHSVWQPAKHTGMAAENRRRRNAPCSNRAGVVVPEELVGIIIEGTAEAVTKNSKQKESLKF